MNDHAKLKYRNVALLPNNLQQMQGQSFLLKYSLDLHPLVDYKARTFWRKISELSPSSIRQSKWEKRICQTARSMEWSIFFFLKSHMSAPGTQNSPIFFPS